MFKIIQSNRTEKLVDHLLEQYKSVQDNIFAPFVVIVPSMVLGDWLDKTIASRAGISTLVTTQFWGQYQWTLMQDVLSRHNDYLLSQNSNAVTLNVPEVAVLSSTVMQWRIFGYLTLYQNEIINSEAHPLKPLLSTLISEDSLNSKLDNESINNSVLDSNSINNNFINNNSNNPSDADTLAVNQANNKEQIDARLWQLANDLARVFNRYLTHREDWLAIWSTGRTLDVAEMIAEKDELTLRFDKYSKGTPKFLVAHYTELEQAQRFLWVNLFAPVHQYRVSLERQFWQALEDNKAEEQDALPKILRIFTIQQLPQTELNFLQRLAQFMDITLLHYNPSKLFWADIVDKAWLQRQQIINPESVFLRDYGHSLLSRLGKQSRDMFAMLANLSGNEDSQQKHHVQVDWQDSFEADDNDDIKTASKEVKQLSLLNQLQKDVLMLNEEATQQATVVATTQAINQEILVGDSDAIDIDDNVDTVEVDVNTNDEFDNQNAWYADDVLEKKRFAKERKWRLIAQDNSLSIHSCYSLQRQLEVLRIMIGRWLADGNAGEDVYDPNTNTNNNNNNNNNTNTNSNANDARHISDIVVLLPDVERHHALINSIFVNGKGQDGLTLPAKVTGVVDMSIRQLWEAIIGFYKLLGQASARFEASEVLDWLMLPPLYENFGLTHEQMSRGCELLIEAGFIRGFDEAHLKQTLDTHDYDYRFSFAHALDRLVLGLVMPEAEASDCLYPLAPDAWAEDAMAEKTLPLAQISLNDAPIIEALSRIFMGLASLKDEHTQAKTAEKWLSEIEENVIHRYFGAVDQTRSMRAIYNAMNGFKSSLRANRHYKQYANYSANHSSTNNGNSKSNNAHSNDMSDSNIEQNLTNVEKLTFRLSFMLQSIEAQLESQQVSAEPTGVITFGRFGALRNVPFKLVVMLNMNLSEFPARDRDNRYDLMKATLSRRGDRVTEDDDNGAFLDALLCAREACWIFYNGFSLTDNHEHLPANPVSELLQFLQGEVQWQQVDSITEDTVEQAQLTEEHGETAEDATQDTAENTASNLASYLPKLVKDYFVTEHPALPFHKSLFESDTSATGSDDVEKLLNDAMRRVKIKQRLKHPPAPLWQQVYAKLKDKTDTQPTKVVALPTLKQYKVLAQIFEASSEIDEGKTHSLTSVTGVFNSDFAKQLTQVINPQLAPEVVFDKLFNIAEIDVDGSLIYQVRHPVTTFLREQQVHILKGEEALSSFEPLELDGLSKYALNDYLINQISQGKDQNDDQDDEQSNARNNVQNDDTLPILLYQKLIPAGVARQTTLPNHKQQLQKKSADFKALLQQQGFVPADNDNLSILVRTEEYATRIKVNELLDTLAVNREEGETDTDTDINTGTDTSQDDGKFSPMIHNDVLTYLAQAVKTIKIKGKVPVILDSAPYLVLDSSRVNSSESQANKTNQDYTTHSPKHWFNLLPTSARPQHLLKFWLAHLYWQVARHTTAGQVKSNDGISVWQFNKAGAKIKKFEGKSTFCLNPIAYETAMLELIKWAIFAKLAGQVPLTLLPDYGLKLIDLAQNQEDGKPYHPSRGDFDEWLNVSYGADMVFDSCSQHPIWGYTLRGSQGNEIFNALAHSLETLAMPLYGFMYQELIPIKE